MEIFDQVDDLLRRGEATRALELLQAQPGAVDSIRHAESLSHTLLQLRQYEQSVQVARQALTDGFDSKRLRDLLAEGLMNLGLKHESSSQAKLGSGGPDILAMQAWVALTRKKAVVAEGLAQKVLDEFPNHASAQGILWGARAAMRQPGAFEKLQDLWLSDHNFVAFDVLVLVAERLERLAEIEAAVREARLRPKVDSQFFYWIVRYYLLRREPEQALAALKESPEPIRTLPRMDLFRGMALSSEKRFAEALPFLERAFQDQPAGVEEGRGYSKALFKLGRYREFCSVIAFGVRSKIRTLPPPAQKH